MFLIHSADKRTVPLKILENRNKNCLLKASTKNKHFFFFMCLKKEFFSGGLITTSLLCFYSLGCNNTLKIWSLSVFFNIVRFKSNSYTLAYTLIYPYTQSGRNSATHIPSTEIKPLLILYFIFWPVVISMLIFLHPWWSFLILLFSFLSNQKQIYYFHPSPFCSFKVKVSYKMRLFSIP